MLMNLIMITMIMILFMIITLIIIMMILMIILMIRVIPQRRGKLAAVKSITEWISKLNLLQINLNKNMKLKGFMIVMGGNLARLMITLERICPFIDCIDLKTCTHFIHECLEFLVKE